MTISNLTFAERARFADNVELRDAYEQLAEWETLTEEQADRIWDLEQELAELRSKQDA